MANIPIKASSEQLMTAAKASEDSAQCVSSASLNDIMQSISTKNIGQALKQVFPENWSEVLGEIYSTMATDSAQMEQLTTNQNFEEFKKSLRDIHKFKARVITHSRNSFTGDTNDEEFMQKIVTPYITRDQDIISSETNKFLTNIENNFMTLYDIYDRNRKKYIYY